MERIYLDQNKWSDLLKARVGHRQGEPFQDVLTLAQAGVEHGSVSFPLSQYHYMELSHRRDYESRVDLAATMVLLSRWHAIAPQHQLIDAEIDRALHQRFGRPLVPRRVQVFGVGPDHTFNSPLTDYRLPEWVPATAEQRRHIEDMGKTLMRVSALVGPPPALEVSGSEPDSHREVGRRFAKEEEERRELRRPEGWHRGDRGRRTASFDALNEYERCFSEALESAGLHWGHLYALEQEGMEQLIQAIPTVYATHRELRRLRHEASQRPWEEGDLVDLAALGAAVVYCDVVCTERQWSALIRRAELDQRFGTVVVSDLRELSPLLVQAASC